ncbi:hypothetical protein M8C21_019859, partial [Ambrosia artemisiifolia]
SDWRILLTNNIIERLLSSLKIKRGKGGVSKGVLKMIGVGVDGTATTTTTKSSDSWIHLLMEEEYRDSIQGWRRGKCCWSVVVLPIVGLCMHVLPGHCHRLPQHIHCSLVEWKDHGLPDPAQRMFK